MPWGMWTLFTGVGPAGPADQVGSELGPTRAGTTMWMGTHRLQTPDTAVGTAAAAAVVEVVVAVGLTADPLAGAVAHVRPRCPQINSPGIYSGLRMPSPSTALRSGCDGKRRVGRAPQQGLHSRRAARGTVLGTATPGQSTWSLE